MLFLGATSASAATIRCYTSPYDRGHATLDTTNNLMYVEDTYADGRRVVATAYSTSGAVLAFAYDANGSNNGPGASVGVNSSSVDRVTTCTQNGTDTSTRANCWTTPI
ncbi:hypothetical protein ACWDE9_43590 [Streptomyces olivaceoviridis]